MKHTYTSDVWYVPALYDLRFAFLQMTTANRKSAVNTSPAHSPAGNLHGQSTEQKEKGGFLERGLDCKKW